MKERVRPRTDGRTDAERRTPNPDSKPGPPRGLSSQLNPAPFTCCISISSVRPSLPGYHVSEHEELDGDDLCPRKMGLMGGGAVRCKTSVRLGVQL